MAHSGERICGPVDIHIKRDWSEEPIAAVTAKAVCRIATLR